ncbi:hypothetical protein FRC01_006549 [Tulasnella sp. 417]|nr:hypothetical protein FRC01_006549 [Tulasnella sp. 417]
MSRVREFIQTSVSNYLALCGDQSGSDIILNDDELTSESAKESMIQTLEQIRDVFLKEAFRLKTRRNLEHSVIHRLPPEILIEILLLALNWELWDTEQLRNLASVSTSWRDTVLSCNRFWPVVDVMGSTEARRMAMKRNQGGPVDVWCWSYPNPTAMTEFMQDVITVPETRWRSVLYEHRPPTQEFLSHLQTQTSNLIDVLLYNPHVTQETTVTLDLSLQGPHLRHVQIWGMGIPWQSPRLANLVTLALANIYRGVPQPEQLYTVLSSSPRLESLSLLNLAPGDNEPGGSLPASSPPIALPVLAVLAFRSVSTSLTRNIVPLIRATACKTVIIDGEGRLSVQLQPQEATIELLAEPITVSDSLKLQFKMEGELCVHVQSEPNISYRWIYWADDKPGVDVRLALDSVGPGLVPVWNRLDRVLGSRGKATNIKTLEIECSTDALGQEIPLPVGLFRFCPEVVTLRCVDNGETALRTLIRLLRRREEKRDCTRNWMSAWLLPRLNHFVYRTQTMSDVDAYAAAFKTFLELRYPSHNDDGTMRGDESPSPITMLDLPLKLVTKLNAMNISTFLKLDSVLRSSDLDDGAK